MIDWSQVVTAEVKAAREAAAARDARVVELRRFLAESDYVGLADYDGEKDALIAQRAEWRAELRKLLEEQSDD